MSTLPQTAFDKLPFSDEPMSQWKEDTDIRTFVEALYSPDYIAFGRKTCAQEEKSMREFARSFTKNLMEVHNASAYLDFYQEKRFGQVAKYAIAMKCCIQSLLEDAGFYSLAHMMESESDMECSLLLAANFYYKQATLMLRNILEEVFLPIHFCDSVSDFDAWKANNYRTPNLRGNDGLIKRLLKKNIIHNPLATQVADLYGNLSSYVHGSEYTLINKNIHLGQVHRVEFDTDQFTAWCKLFCDCIDICTRLLKINYDQWNIIRSYKFESLARVGKTLCHTCHNEDIFDRWLLPSKYIFSEQEEEGQKTNLLNNVEGLSFYLYICQKCGHRITVNAVEASLNEVLCLSISEQPSGISITGHARLVKGTEDSFCEWYTVQNKGSDIITPLLVHLDN